MLPFLILLGFRCCFLGGLFLRGRVGGGGGGGGGGLEGGGAGAVGEVAGVKTFWNQKAPHEGFVFWVVL